MPPFQRPCGFPRARIAAKRAPTYSTFIHHAGRYPGCRAPSALDPDRLPPRCALRTMRADLLPREANVSSCVRGPSRPLCVPTKLFEILPGQRESQGRRKLQTLQMFPRTKTKQRICSFFLRRRTAHTTLRRQTETANWNECPQRAFGALTKNNISHDKSLLFFDHADGQKTMFVSLLQAPSARCATSRPESRACASAQMRLPRPGYWTARLAAGRAPETIRERGAGVLAR